MFRRALDFQPPIADNGRASSFSNPGAMRALTLIEVLIVLVLLSAIMLLISTALDVHLRQMVINRTEVEEAQLARTILENIAKEIRSVVVSIRVEELEVDTTALTSVMGLPGAAEMLSDFNIPETTEETEEYVDEEGEEQILYGILPGIYGGLDWIQIDTAKLPRGELYGSRQIRRGTSFAADRLSASKTVMYYLGKDTGLLNADDPQYQPEKLIGAIGRSYDTAALQYGLFRRQLDRQVMQYATQTGMEYENEQYDEPIAPEVEWIEFEYLDPEAGTLNVSSVLGTTGLPGETGDWVDTWDMDERQMLPAAVMITVAIRRLNLSRSLLSLGTKENPEPVIYSLVVPIPVSIEVVPYDGLSDETDVL